MKKEWTIKKDKFNKDHYYINGTLQFLVKQAIKNYASGLKSKYKHLKMDRYKKNYELLKKLIRRLENDYFIKLKKYEY